MFPPSLPRHDLLILLLLRPPFLCQLALDLFSTPNLILHQYHLGLLPPFPLERLRLELCAVDGVFVLPHQQLACVGDGFIKDLAGVVVRELRLRLFEPVECFGGRGVGCLVWMDEEGLFAVLEFDVGWRHAWL